MPRIIKLRASPSPARSAISRAITCSANVGAALGEVIKRWAGLIGLASVTGLRRSDRILPKQIR
jgi:hypothetical protein